MLTIQKLSKKQRKTLNWWVPNSPVRDAYGIIEDGSVRAGKTLSMGIAYIEWAMGLFDGRQFIMAGKTVGSFRRNVLSWMVPYLIQSGYRISERRTENTLTVTGYGHTNTFHIFGGRDESSQDLVQGVTSAGAFLDEVVLMPESFVNQVAARCSVDGAKLWFNCNPGGPSHWFKKNWLDRHKEKNLLHLHFTMEDNPSLSPERRAFYESLYPKGSVFYKRYILGLWVQAEGAIYDMLTEDNYYDELPKRVHKAAHYIGIDYGTQNACAFLHIIDDGETLWVENEYYYSGRDTGVQKTNSQYAKDFVAFAEGINVHQVIIDPSAASFRVELRQKGFRMKDADNDVLEGIRWTATLLGRRLIKINRRCKKIKEEIEGYVWDPKPTERGLEKPIKQGDHLLDALRYVTKTVISPRRLQS